MSRARIVGVGREIPERALTNADLERLVDTTDRWITERTGIKERRIAADDQVTSDLAAEAGLMACSQAGISPKELDAIIVGTVTPDMKMPATAAIVQHKMDAGNCPAFDISAACAGFLFGLGLGEGLLQRGGYRRILVVGVELLSRVLDWTDRDTCVLFGDAAGAAVLVSEAEESGRGLLEISLHTDGRRAMDLNIRGGGSLHPCSAESVERNDHVVRMKGRVIFSQAVRNMSAASLEVLKRAGASADDVVTVFAHQANLRILEGVSQRTRIPLERFFINIQRYGNTSSASIPVAMSEALEAGQVKEGDLLLLTALGAGLSWASALIRW